MTQHKQEESQGQGQQEPEKLGANIEQVGEWFANAVKREQEEQEGKLKAFDPGEGIEQPLGK